MNEKDKNYQIKKFKQRTKVLKSIGVDGVFVDKDKKDYILNLLNEKGDSPSTKLGSAFKSLHEIKVAVEKCKLCSLCKTRKKTVFSDGSDQADIMFVGEGPGKDEDILGLPFVGRAGQLLDKILSAMELSRDTVYICNIVKCRPPDNRKPTLDEMKSCSSYLAGQIAFVQPKIIVCLGATAAEGILGTKERIMDLRSKFFDMHNTKVLVTYHPAALLRDPSRKKLVWEDMKLVMSNIKK